MPSENGYDEQVLVGCGGLPGVVPQVIKEAVSRTRYELALGGKLDCREMSIGDREIHGIHLQTMGNATSGRPLRSRGLGPPSFSPRSASRSPWLRCCSNPDVARQPRRYCSRIDASHRTCAGASEGFLRSMAWAAAPRVRNRLADNFYPRGVRLMVQFDWSRDHTPGAAASPVKGNNGPFQGGSRAMHRGIANADRNHIRCPFDSLSATPVSSALMVVETQVAGRARRVPRPWLTPSLSNLAVATRAGCSRIVRPAAKHSTIGHVRSTAAMVLRLSIRRGDA